MTERAQPIPDGQCFAGGRSPRSLLRGSHPELDVAINGGSSFSVVPPAVPVRSKAARTILRILEASLLYFAIVFGVGFMFGIVRTLVEPRIGARWAQLAETPFMVLVTIVAARWTTFHLKVPAAPSTRLLMGDVALVWMLLGEFGLVLWVRGLSIRAYFAKRDAVSGAVYYVALMLFASMPFLVVRH